MKRYLMIGLLVVMSKWTVAQNSINLPMVDGKVSLSEVVEVDLTQKQLYNNLKAWFVYYFKSAKNVIQLDDPEAAKVIGKALLEPNVSYLGQIRGSSMPISIQVDCKDNKYRYIVDVIDYNHVNNSLSIPDLIKVVNGEKKTLTTNKGYANRQLESISKELNDLIISLKKAMLHNDDF